MVFIAPKEVILANVEPILHQVPDPRGGLGRQHPLPALLRLILLSMTSGRKGMKAAFRLGRSLTPTQLKALGFRHGYNSPCHATLTQLLRILDPDALTLVFSQVIAKPDDETKADCNHIAIDGKTLRGSKDDEGKAEHVLSAFFCTSGTVSGPYIVARQGNGDTQGYEVARQIQFDRQDFHW